MTRPISVGDLVMVVRCCCDKSWLKHLFVVTEMGFSETYCKTCDKRIDAESYASGLADFCIPLSWLKRIDPLPESETIQHNEEVGA